MRWLRDLMANDTSNSHILFIGHPPLKPSTPALFDDEDDYLQPDDFRSELLEIVRTHNIEMVFSANASLYDEQQIGDTRFITTGVRAVWC